MNAKAIAFFSGFPKRQFTEEIAEELRGILTERKSLVFISAWPDRFQQNDDDKKGMYDMFVARNMSFSNYNVIDERTEGKEAQNEIENASCLFLMGGNATAQMEMIRRKGLFERIKAFKGVILGVSAGSMNMGSPVVDIYESVTPYDGFGFLKITVKAHYPIADESLRKAAAQVSWEFPVTLMKDESAIILKEDGIKIIGEIYGMNKEKIEPLSKEDLK